MKKLCLLLVLSYSSISASVKLVYPKSLENNAQAIDKKEIEELRQKKECPTLPAIRAATPIRRKCFEMLSKAGIAEPQLVYVGVDNNLDKNTYAAVDNIQNHMSKVCTIRFHPNTLKFTHGVQEFLWLHEAGHIMYDDLLKSAKDYPSQQQDERQADQVALHIVKCKQCVLEWAQFSYARARLSPNDYRFSEQLYRTLLANITLHKFCEQNAKILHESLVALHGASRKRADTHPLFLERALSAFVFAQKEKQVCGFHEKREVESNKAKSVALPAILKCMRPVVKPKRIVYKRPKPITISQQRSDPITWGTCGNKMRIGNRWFYSG